jgi:hypothetical protein
MGDRVEGTATEVLERLEAGETPAQVSQTLALGAGDLITALGRAGLEVNPPGLVQGSPKHPRLASALNESAWAGLLAGASRPARLALAAGLFQIFDFWDASHEAAQQADDLGERAVSAYWHGIAHRREPDDGNASYWFRRVGRHPLFARLAETVNPLLVAHGDPALSARLLKGGNWDPFAFIDLCTQSRPDSPAAALAMEFQREEMRLLLDQTASLVLSR